MVFRGIASFSKDEIESIQATMKRSKPSKATQQLLPSGSTVLCSAQALPETSSELGLSTVLEPHKINTKYGVKHKVLLLCRGEERKIYCTLTQLILFIKKWYICNLILFF